MKVKICLFLLLAVLVFAGCARENLPVWAPQKPSPEFRRAAKMLKEPPSTTSEDAVEKAFESGRSQYLPPAWELFGTLEDRQIAELKQKRELLLAYKKMSGKQRNMLERLLFGWETADKELRRKVQRIKPAPNFSNVELVFAVHSGERVVILMQARQPDGSIIAPLTLGIGLLAGS